MRRTILIGVLSLLWISLSATEQIYDKVIIDGETWEIPLSPLMSLDEEEFYKVRDLFGERNFTSTAIYRGYVAYWHIGKRGLYLDKIEIMQENGRMKAVDYDLLKKIMRRYRHRSKIRAEWVCGDVQVSKGIENRTLTINKGKIRII